MCGRCGHLYGRCRISTERRVSRPTPDQNPGKKFSSGDAGRCTMGRCEHLYERCAGDAVISTGDAGSPQRDASPDRPPTRIRGKKILIGRCWEMHPGEMCGRCGHLYGRCRISTERRVSRPTPDQYPGKKILIGRCWEMHLREM